MPTNTLYQPPTVDNAVYQAFGMQPNMDRLNLLPRYDKKLGWVAPNALYQLARAFMTPSVGFRGGEVTPEDALNFGMSVMGTSAGVSRAVPKAVPRGPAAGMATVYHGSPHNFDAFDATKIGTGEGAQAYGHGLYLADNPNVARQYKLAGSDGAFKVDGAPPRPKVDPLGPNRAEAVAYDDAIAKAKSLGLDGAITYYEDQAKFFPNYADEYAKPLEQLRKMKAQGAKTTPVGNLYTSDLPDSAIANMLDWDKPLSQQPHVLHALSNPERLGLVATKLPNGKWAYVSKDGSNVGVLQNGGTAEGFRKNWIQHMTSAPTGAEAYKRLAGGLSNSGGPIASSALNSAGIPGIRYLDAGSRGAGAGTSNYVVFDDKLLKILKKE